MKWDKEARESFIRFFLREYGIALSDNDEMVPVLHAIISTCSDLVHSNSKIGESVSNVNKRLDLLTNELPQQSFSFHNRETAFFWHLGSAVKILIISLVVVIFFMSIYFVGEPYSLKRKAQTIINNSGVFDEGLIDHLTVEDDGSMFIEATLTKDSSLVKLQEFEFTSKDRIRIYIGGQR